MRDLGARIRDAPATAVRPVNAGDFAAALGRVRPSISSDSLREMEAWNREHGSFHDQGAPCATRTHRAGPDLTTEGLVGPAWAAIQAVNHFLYSVCTAKLLHRWCPSRTGLGRATGRAAVPLVHQDRGGRGDVERVDGQVGVGGPLALDEDEAVADALHQRPQPKALVA